MPGLKLRQIIIRKCQNGIEKIFRIFKYVKIASLIDLFNFITYYNILYFDLIDIFFLKNVWFIL